MWPKMLFELLPHFARLMPVADKYLNSRSASDKAQAAAVTALGEDVRAHLAQVTEAHGGLSRQLQEQGAQITQVAVEVTRARMGTESVEARVAQLEKTAGMAVKLLRGAVVLLAMGFVLLVIRMVR
jgi:chromosome segregation ATPase